MKNSFAHIDVYLMVTDLIIERLEQGVIPWQQPWNNYGPATNYMSMKPYLGINQLILYGLHSKPFYLTYKQVSGLGGRVRKGAKSIPIVYWNFIFRHAKTRRKIKPDDISSYPPEAIVKTAFLKYYRVFNIDDILQIDFDIPSLKANEKNNPIEQCEVIISNMKDKPTFQHRENQPYYHPVKDYINIPPMGLFKTTVMYYSVLFHELIHSTGHKNRLNRFGNNEISKFNSSSYSKEELVAEIGAAFLNNQTGILNRQTLTDSTAYIQGWLNKLRSNKKFIIEASAKAQKAVDYIMNKGEF